MKTSLAEIASSDWYRIEDFTDLEEWNWNSVSIRLDNNKGSFVFAFRYQTAIGESNKVMIDNFSVESFEPVVVTMSGESDNFEFYTDNQANSDFYLEIEDALEERNRSYCSHWNIPGLALHTFAGYAHKFRLARDWPGNDFTPGYFTEAFGLYPMIDSIALRRDQYLCMYSDYIDSVGVFPYN